MSNANRLALLALAVPALAVQAVAQQFVRNTTNVPANAGNDTEDVDFVDVDDDWDAAGLPPRSIEPGMLESGLRAQVHAAHLNSFARQEIRSIDPR